MNRRMAAVIASFATAAACMVSCGAPKPKVLMVMFDGARADCYFNAKCPTLHSLVEGTWAKGYGCAHTFCGRTILDARTYSYPNHSAILSGISAAKHGVQFNFQFRQFDSGKFPNWIACLHKAKPTLKCQYIYADGCDASLGNDRTLPMFVPSGSPEVCDAKAADEAVRIFSCAEVPDAATFFLEEPDCSGHASSYYPSDAKYLAAFSRSDAHLGRVLDAIKSRPQFSDEDWLILFTTDHGGVLSGHGAMGGHCETVPMLVVGRHVGHGEIVGRPRLFDLPATALAHFGLKAKDFGMDGVPLGDKVAQVPRSTLDAGLVAYMPFNCRNNTGENAVKTSGITASGWGDLEYLKNSYSDKDPFPAGAPTRLFGRIYGTEGVPVAFRLDGAQKVFADRKKGFAVTFWMRQWNDHSNGLSNPVVMGNKDLSSPKSPGFAIRMADFAQRMPRGMGLEFADKAGNERTLGVFMPELKHWNFYAVSVRPDGVVLFCQGRMHGDFHLIADNSRGADFGSQLPLFVGQDGTGEYWHGDWFDVDEFGLWDRALTPEEMHDVYGRGRGGKSLVDGMKLF